MSDHRARTSATTLHDQQHHLHNTTEQQQQQQQHIQKMSPQRRTCMLSGLICGYTAIDCSNISCICKRKGEFLCLVHESCLDTQEPSLGFGLTTNPDNHELCKLALPCCAYGIKKPERVCASAGRLLCLKSAQAFPLDDEYGLEQPVCACYGIQCRPECRCCGSEGTD